LLDEFADFVAVARASFEERKNEERGAAEIVFSIYGAATY
jgi:hypothetical protein